MGYILEFEEFNDYRLIESIATEIEILIDNYNAPELIENYLYENYGIDYLDFDFINEDINQQEEEENKQGTPKKTLGQKTKEHFKKHWKKYAAGAGAVGGATALGLYGKKKGWFDKKKETPKQKPQDINDPEIYTSDTFSSKYTDFINKNMDDWKNNNDDILKQRKEINNDLKDKIDKMKKMNNEK